MWELVVILLLSVSIPLSMFAQKQTEDAGELMYTYFMAHEGFHFINNSPEKTEEELRKEQEQKINDSEHQRELDELYKDKEDDYNYNWQKRNN